MDNERMGNPPEKAITAEDRATESPRPGALAGAFMEVHEPSGVHLWCSEGHGGCIYELKNARGVHLWGMFRGSGAVMPPTCPLGRTI